MIEQLEDLSPASRGRFDAVIDVRTAAEFALDHLPGAINLPVLDERQRALVGTIYTRESRFKARRLGAALIARNIASHLEGALADKPGSWRPLIYCWRGGQRSGAMTTILAEVGWRTGRVAGGYRSWRRRVKAALYDASPPHRLILLEGDTGSGKTLILRLLAERGAQTLDLEDLAAHRGSLLGALPDRPQPSQKLFESRLAERLEALDPARPTLVEAESSRIGERLIPPGLWRAMDAAPRIELSVPRAARARFVAREYAQAVSDRGSTHALLARLPGRHGRSRLGAWMALFDAGDLASLAEALMEAHYDPAYHRGRAGRPPPAWRVSLDDPAAPQTAIDEIEEALR